MDIINFDDYTPDQKQAWADFTYHEIYRHREDITRAFKELSFIANQYHIFPRDIYLNKWIEVMPDDENTTQG